MSKVIEAGPCREERFQQEILPHLGLLLRAAKGLIHNPADAEELVQDTLLRAYRALDHFDGTYPRAWLLTIMRNLAINRARRPSLALYADIQALAERAPAKAADVGPETIVMESVMDADVCGALCSLRSEFRTVIALVDIEGLTYAEASTVLGIPIGTVMSRLHRGRRAIRERLRPRRW